MKGRLADRKKDPTQLMSGNSGGLRRPGYLFHHIVVGGSKHSARFIEVEGKLRCSVCYQEV